MRILLVKTSSMGDIIHTFPAITDAFNLINGLELDWCVESRFADLAKLHPLVRNVYPVDLRSLKKNLFSLKSYQNLIIQIANLKQDKYDLIIDAQGLIKSAMLSLFVKGKRHGYCVNSARESFASYFYHKKHHVATNLHAIERSRLLFASVFEYKLPDELDYGVKNSQLLNISLPKLVNFPPKPYAIILTATSQAKKYWSAENWIQLILLLNSRGISTILPSGNETERNFCQKLVNHVSTNYSPNNINASNIVLPALSLGQLANIFLASKCCFGVDTGLTHLATALDIPTIAIFTGSNKGLTGVYGKLAWNIGDNQQQVSFADVEQLIISQKII